jgi:hypothetical protein
MLCVSSSVVRLFQSSKNRVGSDFFIISESENHQFWLLQRNQNQRTIDPDHFFKNLKNWRFSQKNSQVTGGFMNSYLIFSKTFENHGYGSVEPLW